MKVFIHQPYFMPWLGFLSKLYHTDYFFILDKAPFRRNHFNRTAILNPQGKVHWITLPVGASQGTPIDQIKLLSECKYIDKIKQTIIHFYSKGNYFKQEFPFVDYLFDLIVSQKETSLSNVNINILYAIIDYLKIDLKGVERESAYDFSKEKNQKMIEIVKTINCDSLICGDGKSTIVHDMNLFNENNIDVEVLPYYSNHPIYTQIRKTTNTFVSGLSFIDALLNIGKDNVKQIININAKP